MKELQKILSNRKIFFIAIAIFVIAIFSCFITVQIVQNTTKRKMLEKPLLTYEVIMGEDDDDDKEEYDILITLTSVEGIETVTYKKRGSNEEMTLNCKGKKVVGIDYTVTVKENYDFKIKQVGKPEVTETIMYEVPYIEGDYSLVGGVYSNAPDLSRV